MTEVKRNDSQFDLYQDGKEAGLLEYNRAKEGILEITHTEVAEEYNGKGLGKELVKAAVEAAKKDGLKIVSSCPYAKKMIEKTPEFKDILAG